MNRNYVRGLPSPPTSGVLCGLTMAMVRDPAHILTIDQVIDLAERALDPGAYAWAAAGAGEEVTVTRNRVALNSLALVPRVGRDVSAVDVSSSFVGVDLDLPVILAPVGALRVYDEGDALSAAEAATSAGASAFCSMFSTAPWEEVAATASGRHFFQIYVEGDRSWQADVLGRVEEAGFAGICVTMDSPRVGRRDRSLESGFTWASPPEGTVNLDLSALDMSYRSALTWADLEWISAQTALPVIVKGVMTPEDALTAVEAGAGAVYVSNHGGRMVDHGLSTIEVLEEIVNAVPDEVDVAVDSGFTRGAEVCKALALGAKAVGIGRLQCWGLAAGGVGMLTRVLEILREEIEMAMANCGLRDLGELRPDLVRWSMPAFPPS